MGFEPSHLETCFGICPERHYKLNITYVHEVQFHEILMNSMISRPKSCRNRFLGYYVSPDIEIRCFGKHANLICESDLCDMKELIVLTLHEIRHEKA